MSSNPLAAFRSHAGTELAALAEEHMQHDLQSTDRAAIESASKKFSTWATVGSLLGLGLGLGLAYRVRSARTAYFNTFRATQRPTHVQFADGRTEALPDLTPLLKPTLFGDVAAYVLFSAGGLFLGGELGMLGGAYSAKGRINRDPESKLRIEKAFRKFKADVLRKQALAMEQAAEHGLNSEDRKSVLGF